MIVKAITRAQPFLVYSKNLQTSYVAQCDSVMLGMQAVSLDFHSRQVDCDIVQGPKLHLGRLLPYTR